MSSRPSSALWRRARVVALGFAFATMLSAQAASAQMLPFIVDRTGEGVSFWWGARQDAPSGLLDRAVFGEGRQAFVPWSTLSGLTISRIFQRPDLTPSHAKQIASMASASTFFLGYMTAEADALDWLSSSAAVVRIQGGLYDARSGALIQETEIVGRGVSSTPQGALVVAARAAASSLALFQPAGEVRREGGSTLQLTVHSSGTAYPFVAIRESVARALLHVADVIECRASEGEITLCIRGLPGQAAEGLQERVVTALRAPLERVAIDRADLEGRAMVIYARELAPEPGIERGELPFP